MYSFSWLHLPTFVIIDYNNFWKIICFNFFPYKWIWDQIWPCRKIGQCQPRGIIWTNLVVLEYSMLHTTFQVHWPFSATEDFESLLAYMGMVAILVMWHKPFVFTFILPSHVGSTLNMASISLVFFEENKFKSGKSEWPWTKDNETPWPLIFILVHVLILFTASTNFDLIDLNSFWKILYLFPIQKQKGPNLTLP